MSSQDTKVTEEQTEYFTYLTDVIREKMVKTLNLPYTQNPETKAWLPVYPDTPGITKIMSSHGSQHVLGHSLWSALYMENFFLLNSRFVQGLDEQEAVLCGFFHDIAKATNCGLTCRENKCWLDVYNPLNYHAKGDSVHPQVGGDVVLGKERFWSECPVDDVKVRIFADLEQWKKTHGGASLLLPHEYFAWTGVDFRVVALTTYMHWEVGNINAALARDPFDKEKHEQAYDKYIALFSGKCSQSGLTPSLYLLRLCMVVAFADILAASLEELTQESKNPLSAANQLGIKINGLKKFPFFQLLLQKVPISEVRSYYTSSNPWRNFKMDQRVDDIFDQVLVFAASRYHLK